MDGKVATADRRIAWIAERQHGVVSIRQLREVGVSDDAVNGRVRTGRLHRVHRGVYAVGHAGLSREGRWMAAILIDRSATLSHRSAAELWRLLPPLARPVHVSVPGIGGKAKHKGVHVHRSRTLIPEMVTRRLGIAVTNPARTIADLRLAASIRGCPASVTPSELRRAIRQAGVLDLPLGDDVVTDRTRSELERLFLRLCRRHDLPPPEPNVKIGPLEVDFLWRDYKLIVETDGYTYHRGRAAFENDRDRDLRLRALGYEVVRLSYRQVADDPERVAGTLKRMLNS
jgi:very-short-patch-repair endonuclease